MGLTATATDAKKLYSILDPDWKDLDEESLEILKGIAKQLIDECFTIYEAKAKFCVVGQIYWTDEDGTLHSSDPKAEKVCLGAFPTEARARDASHALFGAQTAKEHLRTWTLPIHWGSPGAWRKARKEAREAAQREALGSTQGDRLSTLISQSEASWRHCSGIALDDNYDPHQCIRPPGHPGSCVCTFDAKGIE